jgi:preprotein translocase SecE subunit
MISKIYKFCAEVKYEAKKVAWPARQEIFKTFLIVAASIVFFSMACLLLDYIIHFIITFLLNIGK